MSKEKDRIQMLIEEQKTIGNEAIARAVARQIEEEQKQQEEMLFQQLQQAKRYLNNKVEDLRQIRKREKRQLEVVKVIDQAYEKFKQDADYDAFIEVAGKH